VVVEATHLDRFPIASVIQPGIRDCALEHCRWVPSRMTF